MSRDEASEARAVNPDGVPLESFSEGGNQGWRMDVRYGALSNVYGKPARYDGYTFMPAHVELDGSSFSLDYPLSDQPGDLLPPALRLPVSQGIDAAWVRARIPNVFGFTPEPAEIEKSLLYSGFVAVTKDQSVCYPFLCTDHYGRAALMFSNDGPEEAVKRAIADAFWGGLAQDPGDLMDFEERVYHPGAMVWLNYGCQSGRVYCDESEE
jgi:hypothetical protein